MTEKTFPNTFLPHFKNKEVTVSQLKVGIKLGFVNPSQIPKEIRNLLYSQIGNILKTNEELIKSAESFAKMKHEGQFRKDSKMPYSKHLEDVVDELKSMGVVDEDILCTGWLHDTIEDTDTDYDDIYEEFNKKIADYVAFVTKDTRLIKSKQEKAYISQLKKSSWQAKVVKLGDIIANFKDLKNSGYDFATQKNKVKNKIPYIWAIKSGISANKKKIPQLETAQLNLNELLKKYGLKPVSF